MRLRFCEYEAQQVWVSNTILLFLTTIGSDNLMANESMTVRDNADAKIIDVNEDLGSYTAADLRKTIDGLISGASQQIIVNLSEVQHINSTAIGAMVGAAKRLRQNSGDLKVYGLADNLKRTFDLVGASSVLEIYDSESSALAAF
jgi:anti-sigma B factor antagonist